jgi:hypothetical protein
VAVLFDAAISGLHRSDLWKTIEGRGNLLMVGKTADGFVLFNEVSNNNTRHLFILL